ncbi:polysaccharide biosynthesis C-terminal domain-containing protein [Sulfoacidibacillus ferrooxidans]|uniref:Polysaccharide biosynthesis protein C-terminal domain-containing protein n=1 Tax=Sulfoacidibacillus ferrooxidans TaxID=2005001 RepID=A0A9X2AF54_9BACL|nr:polysaccharide biosynthesis C-terminal domain-containing protein [Sulfoacidibacillus ferrooxidans]MCI0183716.1 hypothetical protein [Sulfoacidibacillus ferrooxidans]
MGHIKRTLRTILYKFGVAGLAMISGLFLVPRYLSVHDNGIYKLVLVYFQLAATYLAGYGNYFNYGINRLKLDRAAVIGVIMRIFLQIAIAVGALAIVVALFATRNSVLIYVLFALVGIPLAVLFAYSTKLIQALNEIDWLNRLNTVQILTFVIFAIGLTIWRHVDPSISPYLLLLTFSAWLLSYIISATTAVTTARRVLGIRLRPSKHPDIKKSIITYGRKTSLQQLLTQFNLRGDVILVGILAGTTATSLYAMAVTASEVLWHISSSISLLIYARIASEERNGSIELVERTFRMTMILLISAATVMLFTVPPLIHFALSGRYDRSIPAFQILIVGTIVYGVTNLFTQFCTDQLGKVHFPLYMQLTSIATNTVLCLILIPRIGFLGGAIASTSAYFVGFFMSVAYFLRQTKRSARSLFLFSKADRALLQRLRTRA